MRIIWDIENLLHRALVVFSGLCTLVQNIMAKLGVIFGSLLVLQIFVLVSLRSNSTASSTSIKTPTQHDVFSVMIVPSLSSSFSRLPTMTLTSQFKNNSSDLDDSSKRTEVLIMYISISIAASSILFVSLVIFCFCLAERKRKKIPVTDSPREMNGDLPLLQIPGPQTIDPTAVEYLPLESGEISPPLILREVWEIPRRCVQLGRKLGEGAFGFVFKAVLTTEEDPAETKIVAIKTVKENARSDDRENLLAELEIMKQLKPHPNVVSLIGAVFSEGNCPLVIVEFVPFGDLLGYLRKVRGVEDLCYFDPDHLPVTQLCTSQELMKFAIESAQGMEYLSLKKIVHRDLAARNVLVGTGKTCKITDFGMARDVRRSEIYMRSARGLIPVKWTAIESVLRGIYTTRSDVWSYGVLLFEILTVGGCPYSGMNGYQVRDFISQGYRIPKPMHVDNELYQVMMNCWQANPRKRPTFKQLVHTLQRLEPSHQAYINLSEYNSSDYENIKNFQHEGEPEL